MKALVRNYVGDTDEFTVKVGLHQGSALSPYIFDLVMDVIVDRVKRTPLWSIMLADDIALCGKDRKEAAIMAEDWRRAMEKRKFRTSNTFDERLVLMES